jgi:hypothetical protein
MHLVNQTQCRGVVLVDAAADDQVQGKQLLTAVESIARGRSTGRLQIKVTAALNQEVIAQFCRQAVTAGSIIILPGRAPFNVFHMQEEIICTIDDSTFHHEDVLRICACYRLWRRQNKFRCSAQPSGQYLVDEFCYFYNGSLYTDRVHLFETLVSSALNHSHIDLRSPIEQSDTQGGAP